jgi:futalosine hydrolase
MSRRITFVAATAMEIEPLWEFFRRNADQHSFQSFQYHGLQVDFLVSGIGIMQTTYALMDYISHRHPDLWIQAGIGGAFDPNLAIGQVFQIENEMLAGFGAEDRDGHIIDQFQLGWSDPNTFPFNGSRLECPFRIQPEIPLASGMTTLYAHGNEESIAKLKNGTYGQIENMEGAPFFYISLIRRIPFLSIRAISNLVEPRDKSKWKIKEAIHALNDALLTSLEHSNYLPEKFYQSVHP